MKNNELEREISGIKADAATISAFLKQLGGDILTGRVEVTGCIHNFGPTRDDELEISFRRMPAPKPDMGTCGHIDGAKA